MVLKESLLTLMSDKPISKIKITEICDLADVNRGTFYAHYNDQFDLLKQVQDEFAAGVKELEDSRQTKGLSPLEVITELVGYFGEQLPLCRILFNTDGGSELINKLMDSAYTSFFDEWKEKLKDPSDDQLKMLYVFISNGAAALIREWVLGDLSGSPREIAQFILQTAHYGSDSFVG